MAKVILHSIGTALDKALDAAAAEDWTVVDMKQDWKAVYPSVTSR